MNNTLESMPTFVIGRMLCRSGLYLEVKIYCREGFFEENNLLFTFTLTVWNNKNLSYKTTHLRLLTQCLLWIRAIMWWHVCHSWVVDWGTTWQATISSNMDFREGCWWVAWKWMVENLGSWSFWLPLCSCFAPWHPIDCCSLELHGT